LPQLCRLLLQNCCALLLAAATGGGGAAMNTPRNLRSKFRGRSRGSAAPCYFQPKTSGAYLWYDSSADLRLRSRRASAASSSVLYMYLGLGPLARLVVRSGAAPAA
jgi:hypothetical protein